MNNYFLIFILLLITLILVVGFVLKLSKEAAEEEISFEEKQLIETWIIENNLNQYGDSKDTLYLGGTPLFDEKTGKSIDKYEYILRKHPDRPWIK